ncbi:MAG: carbohydrate kinase family protein [Solirubrobacteraceae bacterium]
MTAPIVVAGEALYDLVAGAGGKLAGHPGGGPFNTARTIGRLGQPVAFLGRISTDGLGRTLEQRLRDDGVDLGGVVATDAATTLAIADVDPDGVARYHFHLAGTSVPGLTVQAALAALPATVGALHVGTLGLVLEPLAAALEAVVEELAGRTMVTVDPNCRPEAIDDSDGYRARLDRILARSHLVKVSEEDLAWLRPGAPPLEAARGLLERGPTVVLLTCGPAGAVAIGAGGAVAVAAPEVRVVDTIGAGDAFAGGFLAWWHSRGLDRRDLARHDVVVEATEFAVAVAALTCERAGASPPSFLAGAGMLAAAAIGHLPV